MKETVGDITMNGDISVKEQRRLSAREKKSNLPDNSAANGIQLTSVKRLDNDNGAVSPNGVVLDNQEDEVETKPEKKPMVSFFQLFRYADKLDRILMVFGTLCAMGVGCAMPANLLVYGSMTDIFISNARNASSEPIFDRVRNLAYWYILIGCIVLIVGYCEVMCWCLATERMTHRIRLKFFSSVMKQEIGWFDTHQSGELTSRLADDVDTIHSGLGDKFAMFIQWVTTFFAGYIIGFVRGWKLTLVVLATAPLVVLCAGFMARFIRKFTVRETAAYARAGAIAEEVLSAIKTVAAFGGEKKELDRYTNNLYAARALGVNKGITTGVGTWAFFSVIFGSFGLAFWYGGELVRNEGYTPGTILQVFFGVLVGSMSLGHAAPNVEALASARGAASQVYQIIEKKSNIDITSEEGEKPTEVSGNVELEDVYFNYPARPDVPVAQGLSLKISRGQTVALVGPSGCGKSTVVQLVMRFYDPLRGVVKLDGRDLRSLNLAWLRQHVGVVSQEPVLFATTIAENIRYGCQKELTQDDIEKAAVEANAHDFIMKLPQKYETMVGERGAQLSGGQKQRIAIARALVGNPKVLLLDEATSALDTESESVVQEALDKASEGRTTLVIAHRLSTIKNADMIVAIEDGHLSECGTHEELMEQGGLYWSLVTSQLKQFTESETGEQHFDKDEENMDKNALEVPRFEKRSSWRWSEKRQMSAGSGRQHLDSTGSAEEVMIKEELPETPLKRIIRLNAPEWPYIVVGCITAIITGAVHPGFALIMSEILGTFAINDVDEQRRQNGIYAGVMAAFGLAAGMFMFVKAFCFAKSGEYLTMRLRQLAFKTMLKQDMSWFDEPVNQVGALTARLASDASMVRGATGSRLATVIEAMSNIGIAVVIAFVFGWRLAFVTVAFMPFIVMSGWLQGRLLQGFSRSDKTALDEGGKLASEAITNIRTVAALTREKTFTANFENHFRPMYKMGQKKCHILGIGFSFSQSVIFFAYAAVFTYGAFLVQHRLMTFVDVFRVFSAIVFGGQALGRTSSFAPDYAKGKVSAARIFKLLDRQSEIDPSDPSGTKPESCDGSVTIRGVSFAYPQRPKVTVLNGLSISVQPGQILALVGTSGCGKSTTVQLIERFYDPHKGNVMIEGQDTRTLNLAWMRSQIGIVSQEPVLFDASIADNIAYGDNSREVPMEEIIEAARNANIHNFIQSLPNGYDTNVGAKGTQLSGGQKQRVAIARALVRNPKILLLDEATSALDTESEKIVQEALDRAQKGRTSIVIAHRLSTIQDAHKIAVFKNGYVVECGTHEELMVEEGLYYNLQLAQHRKKKRDNPSVVFD